jgi:hypothetical protein
MIEHANPPTIEAGAKLQMVKVTNKNDFVMRDRFDGSPYTFLPNQPESIPPQAAAHFFGWPGEPELMKAHTCRRFGWNRPEHIGADKTKPESQMLADTYWSNIVIEVVTFSVVPDDANSPLPDIGSEDEPMTEGAAAPMPLAASSESLTRVGGPRRRGRPRKVVAP